ncbi:MAG: tetraacyldisaccharide 4'-kinase [Magnetococcales bacterium]|nr:tetraacyldisaccharide 4'-kinase [Magnetococcales bacterium]
MQTLLPWLNGEREPDSPGMRLLLAALGGCGTLLGRFQSLKADGYRRGWIEALRAPCPVISVGNLTVGGTGKTPMVLWLARRMQSLGHRVGIVSRGYRQRSRARVTVVADPDGVRLSPPEAADEAVLLARALPGVTVLTGADRPALIRHGVERYRCSLILMDDGFQRLDVQRDLDLVLLDARHPFGNGRLLPGGILRESIDALARCDALILTRADDPERALDTRSRLVQRFPRTPLLTATHRPTVWIPLSNAGDSLSLDGLSGAVLAFCGLAAPEGFRRTLAALPLRVTSWHPFPDHHAFQEEELQHLVTQARRQGAGALVCTEKDAVKLSGVQIPMPVFALRVEMALQHNREWLEHKLAAFGPPTAS